MSLIRRCITGPTANVKGKEKEKKDGPRQATLFSMMPSKSNKPVVKKNAKEHASPFEPDSQADITMSDALAPSDAGTLVETQIDSQQSLADDWEETQIVEEGALSSSMSEVCFSTSPLDKRAERHSRISMDWMVLYCNIIYLLFLKLKTTVLRVGGCYAF
jgi:hypothetical protein